MFDQIDFYIHGSQIEVAGRDFLLGELTADVMNISPAQFDALWALSERAETETDAIPQLHALLRERTLFRVLCPEDKFGTAEQYRSIVSDIYSFNQTMFWFVDRYLMHLLKLNAENYAAAL